MCDNVAYIDNLAVMLVARTNACLTMGVPKLLTKSYKLSDAASIEYKPILEEPWHGKREKKCFWLHL